MTEYTSVRRSTVSSIVRLGRAGDMVDGVGIPPELQDGGDRPAVGRVRLPDPQLAVAPLTTAVDFVDAPAVGVQTRGGLGVVPQCAVVALGRRLVGCARQEEAHRQPFDRLAGPFAFGGG